MDLKTMEPTTTFSALLFGIPLNVLQCFTQESENTDANHILHFLADWRNLRGRASHTCDDTTIFRDQYLSTAQRICHGHITQ
jgi:hypothetical protein